MCVGAAPNPGRAHFGWFLQLRWPRWRTVERWIPLIWIVIHGCLTISSLLCWNAVWSLALMAGDQMQLLAANGERLPW